MHNDAAGDEACQLWLSKEEAKQLKGAIQEFIIKAFLPYCRTVENLLPFGRFAAIRK